MNREKPSVVKSPILQNHTPLKRLGLSRKRKRCSTQSLHKSLVSENETSSSGQNIVRAQDLHVEMVNKKDLCHSKLQNVKDIDYENEIYLINKRIDEKEEKLKSLQKSHCKILELENLIDVWKKGCKDALLHLNQIFDDKQKSKIERRNALTTLGVWDILVENFENDKEINLLD